MSFRFKKLRIMVLLLCVNLFLSAQSVYEFVDKDLTEILYSVSLAEEVSITCDDTVIGRGDFRWAGDGFEKAFEAFLMKNRLYVVKEGKNWFVSRISLVEEEKDGEKLFALDASDVIPARILEEIGKKSGVCVTYEALPQIKVSLHSSFCSVKELLGRVCALCPGYETEEKEKNFFHVAKSGIKEKDSQGSRCQVFLNEDFSLTVDLANCSFGRVIEKIFSLCGNDYCFTGSPDGKIVRSFFTAESVTEGIELLCSVAGYEWNEAGSVSVFSQAKDKNCKLPLKKQWSTYRLKNVHAKDIWEILKKQYTALEVCFLKDPFSFIYQLDEKEKKDFEDFVQLCDKKNPSRLVKLKYIQTEDFLKKLPPFVSRQQIGECLQKDAFYFTGSDEEYEELMERLEEVDKPVSRISYDLLIIQYQGTDGQSWNPLIKVSGMRIGDRNDVEGALGSVMDFSLDVAGVFGRKFALDLHSAISESKAKVYADTTLNGVSGSSITFSNTSTYRYRDNNLDPETGKPVYSGITKEIISGLKLDINGTVSGDGMITTKISASVSRRGMDLSTTTGNPPPTSEKNITTEVRTKSGEPVVLSGLVQNEETEAVSRVPFLSRIPLLGRLFKSSEKSSEKIEMVIYLLPKAECSTEEKSGGNG